MARSCADNMRWLGSTDKAIFRILTGVGGEMGMSWITSRYMPEHLPARKMYDLSSRRELAWGTLKQFHEQFGDDAWLIGGPTLARIALEEERIHEVHLCRSDRMAFPERLNGENLGLKDTVTPYLEEFPYRVLKARPWWSKEMQTSIGDVTVECWRRHVKGE